MFGTGVAKWGRREVCQMTDGQIKQILSNMKKMDRGYKYETTDRDIYLCLDEVAPYVIGYKRYKRSFVCDGLSPSGKALLD